MLAAASLWLHEKKTNLWDEFSWQANLCEDWKKYMCQGLQELEFCEWQMKLLTTWFIDLRPFSNVKLRPQVLAGHLMGPARECLVVPFKQSLIAQQLLVVGPHTTTGWHGTTHWLTLDHTPGRYQTWPAAGIEAPIFSLTQSAGDIWLRVRFGVWRLWWTGGLLVWCTFELHLKPHRRRKKTS